MAYCTRTAEISLRRLLPPSRLVAPRINFNLHHRPKCLLPVQLPMHFAPAAKVDIPPIIPSRTMSRFGPFIRIADIARQSRWPRPQALPHPGRRRVGVGELLEPVLSLSFIVRMKAAVQGRTRRMLPLLGPGYLLCKFRDDEIECSPHPRN